MFVVERERWWYDTYTLSLIIFIYIYTYSYLNLYIHIHASPVRNVKIKFICKCEYTFYLRVLYFILSYSTLYINSYFHKINYTIICAYFYSLTYYYCIFSIHVLSSPICIFCSSIALPCFNVFSPSSLFIYSLLCYPVLPMPLSMLCINIHHYIPCMCCSCLGNVFKHV